MPDSGDDCVPALAEGDEGEPGIVAAAVAGPVALSPKHWDSELMV